MKGTRKMWTSGIVAAAILFALFSAVFAEEKKDSRGQYDLDQITVSDKGAREPRTSPYAVPESSKLQTEIFTREDIESIHPETVLDILQFAPGIEVTYQGRRQFDFTNIRGQGSLGIVLDGVYIPAGPFSQRVLATFPVDVIESITIVRDPTALTLGPLTNFGSSYGSSNQGFIVIKTRRAAKLEGGVIGSYGSFHTQKEHVYQGAKIQGTRVGDFDYRLAYTHQETLGKTGWYNASRNDSLYFRGGYAGNGINADMFYYDSNGMREMQRGETYDGTLHNAKWKYDPMLSSLVGINLSKPWSLRQTTTFTYSHGRADFDAMTTTFPRETPVTSARESDWSQNFNLKHVVAFTNNTLRLGGQLLSQRTSQDMYSLYAHDEHRMFNNRLSVDGGIRVDKKYYRESPVTGSDLHDWSKEVYTFALGAAYKITRILTATGRYAYSENTLASFQIDADTKGVLPPEKRSRLEGGLLANIHPSFNPLLTLFYYDTKDQIVSSVGPDPTTGRLVSSYVDPRTGEEIDYVTTSDVRTKGAEIGIFGAFLKSFSYNLNYSYMTTDNAAVNRGQPHVTASGRLGYRFKNLEANVNARYYGPWSSSTSDGQVATYDYGDFINWGANVSYTANIFRRPAKITLYGQNLGDNHFTTRYRAGVGAFKDPGRRFGVELAYAVF
ncbi:MAG: Vitamin B12 transporter BtuB [Syntrophorhabdaceae bacterium PtaU1.Bin034]|nr:MAG: Vitamin B12 transporter BtuB [Syntrophorhabdaceae bacterium PtaU1.Bin034]